MNNQIPPEHLQDTVIEICDFAANKIAVLTSENCGFINTVDYFHIMEAVRFCMASFAIDAGVADKENLLRLVKKFNINFNENLERFFKYKEAVKEKDGVH